MALVLICSLANPCLAKAPPSIEMNLGRGEIMGAAIQDGRLWIKLTPCSAAYLKRITSSHRGEILDVDVHGVSALRVSIFGVIGSGVLVINDPSSQLLRATKEYRLAPNPSDTAKSPDCQ